MAEELAGAGEQAHSRMSGYPSGRSVLTECMVERFSRSPHEWEDAFKNRDNRSKMLTEILAVESATKSGKGGKGQGGKKEGGGESAANKRGGVTLAPSPFNTQEAAGDGDEGDAEGGGNGKDKRRRQRGRGKRGKSSKSGEGGGGEGANAADQSAVVPEAGRIATEGETPVETRAKTGGGGSETRENAAENGSGRGEKSLRKVAKGARVVGGPDPVPKKKRRRKEEQLEGGGVGEEGAAGKEEADLSFVMDAIKKSVSAEGQAAVAAGKRNKKGNKKDKKKNKKEASASDSGSTERGGDATPRETAVEEAPARVAAQITATDSAAKKKKRRKAEVEAKVVAVDPVSERNAGVLAKQEAGDGGAGAEPKTVAGFEKSSGKKRKKTSSGGGFRLF